jgi:flagellar biosynthetic protein FliP
MPRRLTLCSSTALLLMLLCASAHSADSPGQGLLGPNAVATLTPQLRTLLTLTLLSFIPLALIAMTSFTRIIVTLSFLRHAIGMPETPPNSVLITLALFLTFFTMAPVLERSASQGLMPFINGTAPTGQALEAGVDPLKEFMLKHVREDDVAAVARIAKAEPETLAQDPPLKILVPAFMLSELRAGFTAGFIIFLPFLLIDLLVAAVLMALGMMMVPPATISLPLKVLLFVLIDGWSLLVRAIAGAYA